MIDNELYKDILDNGLLLDHYFLLCNIKNGVALVNSKRVQGFINLMKKKGYIEGDSLTEKGIDLVQNCEFSEMIAVPEEGGIQKVDSGTWILGLHKKCQDKLFELTGKRQYKAKINKTDKKEYNFLPNATDLGRVVLKVMQMYKIKDYDKVEKTILGYIQRCYNTSYWFPLLGYYIFKNNNSQMVTELSEGGDESSGNVKSSQKFI